jgi:hypothetical protein
MHDHPHNKGIAQPSPGVTGLRTRETAYARTRELALIAGRRSHEIKQVDYERAKREVTGESHFDRQQAVFDSPEWTASC